MTARRRVIALVLAGLALGAAPAAAQRAARIGDLTSRAGDVPRRIVGYGLVVGLDGTGDRAVGGFIGETPTIRAIINLLRRFNIQVPPISLQSRNAAAVLVTAEVSPYLRPGGRFEVQVSSLGDATSLRGGVLWMTPLLTDPLEPPIATAQGPLIVGGLGDAARAATTRGGNSARVPEGGVLEVEPPPVPAGAPRLQLRRPDLGTASAIARAVNGALGDGTARVLDAGAVALAPKGADSTALPLLLAAIDTLPVAVALPARVIISARDGTVVAGGEVTVGPAAISHRGITLRIGGPADSSAAPQGLVAVRGESTVQQVAAGLHAAGATSQEMAAIFTSLVDVGALLAQVVVR
ncbi:MAG: flagellar basal body P-ring protein FlgI [Gemmatimonadales bacterium]|nr:flagellar basal body P-ring protein FlgI [Gemmatimonadales bacterium]